MWFQKLTAKTTKSRTSRGSHGGQGSDDSNGLDAVIEPQMEADNQPRTANQSNRCPEYKLWMSGPITPMKSSFRSSTTSSAVSSSLTPSKPSAPPPIYTTVTSHQPSGATRSFGQSNASDFCSDGYARPIRKDVMNPKRTSKTSVDSFGEPVKSDSRMYNTGDFTSKLLRTTQAQANLTPEQMAIKSKIQDLELL